jgi:hypothetical protein
MLAALVAGVLQVAPQGLLLLLLLLLVVLELRRQVSLVCSRW